MHSRIPKTSLWIFGLAVFFGCQKSSQQTSITAPTALSLDVICTTWSSLEFVNVLAGGELTTQLIEPETGLSWRNRREFFPNDDQLAMLAGAKLVVDNGPGVAYVNWFGMSAVAEDRVCNSSVNFRLDDYIPIKDYQSVHSHGPEGEHSHDYLVPYCWHDPALAAKQVVAIQKSLGKVWPELAAKTDERAAGVLAELAKLGTDLKAVGAGVSEETDVVLATPDLMFLARAMGLKARYELWFDEVDDETWGKRIQALRPDSGDTKKVVLLWPGAAPEIVRSSAGESVVVVEIDMLESGSIEGSFLQRFAVLVGRLDKALSENPVGR